MSLPVALTPGTVIGGHYIIGDVLNSGGFSIVYRGVDVSEGNRPCAIKETSDVTPATRRQALMEASVLFTVSSPHLPAVYDALEANGRFYLVMQLIEGQNLLQLLRTRVAPMAVGEQVPSQRASGPCSEQEVLDWLLPLMDVLQELHSRRPPVMHRDIKPGNIVLTPGNTAVLLDFGLTKLYDPTASTQTLGRAVTEGFSPIEQYIGKTSPQSDIYSLGATMYLLLTNCLPPSAMKRATYDALIAPRLLNPTLSPNMERALLKALSLHADQRFQSMAEFVQVLRDANFTGYSDPTIAVTPPFSPLNAANIGAQYAMPTVAAPAPAYSVPGYPPNMSNPAYPSPMARSGVYPGGLSQGYNPYPPAGAYPPSYMQPPQGNVPAGGQQQMMYPGPAPVTPAVDKKKQRVRPQIQRPLPTPSGQGCLWGLCQGVLAATLVCLFRNQADFYLGMFVGFFFYLFAGFMTTRRGGDLIRGAWGGYWSGIFGFLFFWIALGIGLLLHFLQVFQQLAPKNATIDSRMITAEAWSAVAPQWPPMPSILAHQPAVINFLALMLLGVIVAWILGLIGAFLGRMRLGV